MTAPGEKPTNIKFHSVPSTGTKEVLMDERGSTAYLRALNKVGALVSRKLVSDNQYAITIHVLKGVV